MKLFSDISIWWLIPWALIAAGISVWYYRNQRGLSDASTYKKALLTGLRASSIFILGLLFIGLLIESVDYKTQKPVFITLVDHSASMLNYSDSSKVKSSIEEIESRLETQFGDRFDLVSLRVGEGISQTSVTDFSAIKSNLDAGFEFIHEQYYNQNIGGICFISDGNFNDGKSPVYSAAKIPLTPVFSVGIGDTIKKRDLAIRNVTVNDIAFLNNQFPVEVDLRGTKLQGARTRVSIWKNGEKLMEEEVSFENEPLSFKQLNFILEAKNTGFLNYTVKAERIVNESTYENNEWSFYVEVLDSRSKVLMLAHAPHPDIAAIKYVIEQDQNSEVESKLISEWNGKLDGYSLLIWHDPAADAAPNLITAIKKTKIPVWYILGAQSNREKVNDLGIGIRFPGRGRTDIAQASVRNGFQLFELSDDLKKEVMEWPPLTVPFGGVGVSSGDVLFTQRVGPVVKDDPVLIFTGVNGRKSGVLAGEGIWKWKFSEYSRKKETKAFDELIQKTTQYLTVKKNNDPLRVQLPKRFSVNEEVIINAEFYNSSLESITKPDINLELTDAEGKTVDYTFAKQNQSYKLLLGKLKEGTYSWTARTKYDGKQYAKSGRFVVVNSTLENLESHANHTLLRQLSEKSNGAFYHPDELSTLLEDISKRKDIVNVNYAESSFKELIDVKWLFFLLILLLGTEWFLRRRAGSY